MSEQAATAEAPADSPSEAPPSSPASPVTKEEDKPKEVSQERQRKEIDRLANNVFYRALDRVRAKEAEGKPLTEAEKKLKFIIDVEDLKDGSELQVKGDLIFPLTEKNVSGASYSVSAKLRTATYSSDSELLCQFEDLQGNPINPARVMKREDIVIQQVLAEKGKIIDTFEGTDQEVVKRYVSLHENPDADVPEGTIDLIKAGAKEAGMLTVDVLVESMKNAEAQIPNLGPQGQEETAKIVAALKEIEARTGGHLLDRENFRDVFQAAGYTPEKFQEFLKGAQTQVKQIEEALKTKPKNKELQDQLIQARIQVKVYEQAITAFDNGGMLDQFFTKMDGGEIPQDQAKKYVEMIRKGDLREIVNEMADKSLPEEERKKLKEQLIELGKKGGLISLFLMILLGTGAENFKGVVSLDQR